MGNLLSIIGCGEVGTGAGPEAKYASPEKPKPLAAEGDEDKKPAGDEPTEISDLACFGAGCYWGTEKFFVHKFQGWRSVSGGKVGFMGPATAKSNPSYEEVCRGDTGHVEVFHFSYSGGESTYRELCQFFFQFHDPTTLDRQQNDIGTQYASVIFCYDDMQMKIATETKQELQALIDSGKVTCYKNKTVVTDIRKATIFYAAHAEHQEYLDKNPKGYCSHKIFLKEWPSTTQTTPPPSSSSSLSQ